MMVKTDILSVMEQANKVGVELTIESDNFSRDVTIRARKDFGLETKSIVKRVPLDILISTEFDILQAEALELVYKLTHKQEDLTNE